MTNAIDILSEAIQILGPPIKIEEHRGWAVWWCPFHNDEARGGKSKRPNFGINFSSETGYWKCLRCGVQGPSLKKLRQQMGTYTPPPVTTERVRAKSQVGELDEALVAVRAALRHSKAWDYLTKERKVAPQTILTYGLGYGLSRPEVHLQTLQAAQVSRLVARKGWWLWAQGVVYAEPLTQPKAIQVRHRRKKARNKYQTWGRQLVPYGSWRIGADTKTLISVEGRLDMLILAQALEERGQSPTILPIYTGGSSPSHSILNWYQEHVTRYRHILIPDPDEAGWTWTKAISNTLAAGGSTTHEIFFPPGDQDPDEAILAGWWPAI